MKSKKKWLTLLLLAIFLVTAVTAVTLLATGCGDPTEIAKPTVSTTSFVYNGSEQGLAVASNNDYTVSGDLKATDVGTYSVTVALKDKKNNIWKGGDSEDLTYTYTITQADNAFTTAYATANYTYGETPATTAAVAKFGTPAVKYYSDEACTTEIAGMTGFADTTAVGTYYVKVTVAGTTNYKELSEVYTVVVDKIEVEKPTVETTEFTYNGEAQGVSVAESELYTVTGEQKQTDAGEYSVTVALKDKTNYKWADGDSEDLTIEYTIAKADNEFTTEYATAGYTYGAEPSTTDAVAKFGTPAVKYYSDEACTTEIDGMTGFAATTNAGTYYVKVAVDGTDNYTALSEVYTVVVSKAEVQKPTATEDSFVYDGDEHSIKVPASELYTVTSEAKTKKGEYTATVALNDKNNYQWADGDSADLTLNWTISEVANGWTTEYHTPDYVFGGRPTTTDPVAEFGNAVVKFYSDEACQNEIEGMTGFAEDTPAGTYYVKVTVKGTESYGKLDKTYTVVVSQFEVEKPTVETTEFTYNGEAQGLSIAASDYYTVTGAQKNKNAGTYTVTVALNDAANYKWKNGDSEDLTFTYTIDKATVAKPTIDTKSFAYNGKEQTVFTAPADAEYTVSGNTAKNVGNNYTVTFALNDKANYTWNDGTDADINISWQITYGTATVTNEAELTAAFADAGYNVIKLGSDVSVSAVIKIEREVTLDLATYTLSVTKGSDANAFGDANFGGVALRVNKGGNLTIKGENGTIDGTAADKVVPVAAMGGNVTIESGTIKVKTGTESCVFARYGGKVTIKGGTFINEFVGEYAYGGGAPLTLNVGNNTNGVDDVKGGTGVIEVLGGTFVGRSPEKGDDALGGNFVADGLKVAGNLAENKYYVLAAGATVPANIDYVRYYGDKVGGVALAVSADAYSAKGLAEVIAVSEIKLMNDMSVDASVLNGVTGKTNGSLTLDLNTKALTLTTTKNPGTTVLVENGFALTIKNGNLNANNAVYTTACFVIGKDSAITFDKVTVESTGSVLLPQGDAAAVNVIDSTITTTGVYGVATNAGSDANYGVVITIKDSTIIANPTDGDAAAVMINVGGTLDISNSKINSTRQGVIVRAGNATLTNVNVNVDLKYADGIGRDVDPANWGGGNEVAYGALVVGNNTAGTYKADAKVTVNGGSLNCVTGVPALANHTNAIYAVRLNSAVYSTNVTLDGVTLGGQVVNHHDTATLTGLPVGTQVVNALVSSANNLTAALNAGGYVKQAGDITADVVVTAGKTATLDLNGYTLTGNIVNNGSLEIKSGAAGGSVVATTGDTVVNNGTLKIVGGKFDAQAHQKSALLNNAGATVTITGGEFVRSAEAGTPGNNNGNSWYVVYNVGTFEMTGGRIEGTSGLTSTFINEGTANAVATAELGGDAYICGERIAVKNGEFGVMTISGGKYEIVADAGNNATGSEPLLNYAECTITGGEFLNNAAAGTGAQIVYNYGYAYEGITKGATLIISGGKFTAASDAKMIYQCVNSSEPYQPTATVTGGTFMQGTTSVAVNALDLSVYAKVKNVAQINAALAAEYVDIIKLGSDITQANPVVITRDVTIDLAGYTVTATAGEPTFEVTAGNVVIQNGNLACTGTNLNTYAPRLVEARDAAAKLTMNNVHATSTGYGIGIFTDAYVELNNCEITAAWQVIATNNGMGSATVAVNGGKLTSTDDAAIYLSCYTDVTLTNVAVTGKTAVDFRVGKLTVVGGSLTSTTAHKKLTYDEVTYANGTHAAGEGSAVHVRANFYYDNNENTNSAEISISDSTVITGVLSVYDMHGAKGMLANKDKVIDQIDALKTFIAGFKGEKHFYEVYETNKLVIAVDAFGAGNTAYVASANELKAVMDAGYNPTLIADITADVEIAAGKTATLDLGAYTLTGKIVNNGTLTVKGSGTVSSPTDHAVYNNGNLTIEGGTFDALADDRAALYNESGATATITGGTFLRSEEKGTPGQNNSNSWYVVYNAGTFTMTGGRIEGTSGLSSTFINLGTANAVATAELGGDAYICGERIAVKNDEFGVMTITGGTYAINADDSNNSTGSEALLNVGKCTISGGEFVNYAAAGSGAQMIYNWGYNFDNTNEGEVTLVITGGTFVATANDARIIYMVVASGVDKAEMPIADVSGGTFSRGGSEVAIADLDLNPYGKAGDYDTLAKMAVLGVKYVTLTSDITATNGLTVTSAMTLDLNGYTLTGDVTVTAGTLTVNNANEVKGGITGRILAYGDTAEVIINGGKFANNNDQVMLLQNGAKGTINGGEFVWTYANGNTNMIELGGSSGNATLTVNDGKFDSAGYAFAVLNDSTLYYNGGETVATWTAISGNNTVPSANIYVTGGTLTAREDTVVYMPSAGILEITGGTLTGNSVVDIRQGKLTVGGGATLNATKENWSSLTKKPGGTTIADGSAIIVNAYFYNSQIANQASSIEINIDPAANVTAKSGRLITVYNWNSVEQTTAYDFGGRDANYYEYIDGSVVEVAQAATAEELSAAVDASRVVMLTADITADVEIAAGKTVKLDLNGHKLTNVGNHTIVNKGNLTVTDTSAGKTGVIDNVTHVKAAVRNEVGATFTLEAGTLTRSLENGISKTENGGNSYYVLLNHGTAYLKGGSVTQNGHYSSMIENGWQKGADNTTSVNSVMYISGGTFSGGLNTVKNDDYGELTITGGTFTNNSQAAVLNWNIAEITGGTFTVTESAQAVILNGYANDTMDKGQLTVTGGEFGGAPIFARHSSATNGGKITVNSEALRDAALAITDATVEFARGGGITNVYVYDEASLRAAIAGEYGTIILTKDIALAATIDIGRDVVIDFNGYTVTANLSANAFAFKVSDNCNATVEIKNGKIVSDQRGIYAGSGKVTLTGLTVVSELRALGAYDNSEITVGTGTNLTTSGNDATVAIIGAGDFSAQPQTNKSPKLHVYGTIINESADGFAAIQGNGIDHSYTFVTVYDGAVVTSLNGSAIYYPQAGELNILGGTLTGYSAIGIKSGKLNITGGTLIGNGAFEEIVTDTNGINLDGSAIVIDSNGAYGGNMEITISGGKLISNNAYGIREIGKTDDQTSIVSLNITGGEITSAAGKPNIQVREITKSKVAVSGGVFSSDVDEFAAAGKGCVIDPVDGKYKILAVETINDLTDLAVLDMTKSHYLVLENDLEIPFQIDIEKEIGIVIDLNSHKITSKVTTTSSGVWNGRGFYITKANVTFKNGNMTATADSNGIIYAGGGATVTLENLTIENGKADANVYVAAGTKAIFRNITSTSVNGSIVTLAGTAEFYDVTATQSGYVNHFSSLISVQNGGTANIHSGTYNSENYGLYVFNSGGTINVSGGTFAASKAVLKADNAVNMNKSVINVSGGSFTGSVEIGNNPDKASMAVSGGTFSVDVGQYCTDLYKTELADGKYNVVVNPAAEITIGSAEELRQFSAITNAMDVPFTGKVTLTADIDLEGKEFTPIGKTHGFSGTFDGQGHTISNLVIDGTSATADAELTALKQNATTDQISAFTAKYGNTGLFGKLLTPGTIMNLNVHNATVKGYANVGVIVGGAYTGAISNCHVTGLIKVDGYYKVGGITGEGYASINDCSVIGEAGSYVKGTYYTNDLEGDNVGGIVGFTGEGNGTYSNLSAKIDVYGSRKVGGLFGYLHYGKNVENSTYEGTVHGNSPADYRDGGADNNLFLGGIAGEYAGNATYGNSLNNCTAKVTFVTDNAGVTNVTGGIVGGTRGSDALLSVTNCHSTVYNAAGELVEDKIYDGGGAVTYNVANTIMLEHLADLTDVGYDFDGDTVLLTSDIDLAGLDHKPIGNSYTPFSGTFDGGGHTVKNMKVSENAANEQTDRSIGLIGYANGCVVKNLKIENCDVRGRYALGAVIGEADGPTLLENIEVISGTIVADQNSADKIAQVAGGILGIGYGDTANDAGDIIFRNCVNRADITVNKQHAGGLWGSITFANNVNVIIENCHNYGTITSNGITQSTDPTKDQGGYAGGFGGYLAAKTLTITDSSNSGTISAKQFQGNFVGYWTATGGSIDTADSQSPVV